MFAPAIVWQLWEHPQIHPIKQGLVVVCAKSFCVQVWVTSVFEGLLLSMLEVWSGRQRPFVSEEAMCQGVLACR